MLLEGLGDDRARWAIYALRKAFGEMDDAGVLAVLRGAPTGKVTVAKEVVRLLGELPGDQAFGDSGGPGSARPAPRRAHRAPPGALESPRAPRRLAHPRARRRLDGLGGGREARRRPPGAPLDRGRAPGGAPPRAGDEAPGDRGAHRALERIAGVPAARQPSGSSSASAWRAWPRRTPTSADGHRRRAHAHARGRGRRHRRSRPDAAHPPPPAGADGERGHPPAGPLRARARDPGRPGRPRRARGRSVARAAIPRARPSGCWDGRSSPPRWSPCPSAVCSTPTPWPPRSPPWGPCSTPSSWSARSRGMRIPACAGWRWQRW